MKFLGLANAFAGGLFLGIGLFHLMPEANENFEEKNKKLVEARLTYYLCFMSYSLIVFVEKVAFNSHALIIHDHEHEHGHIHEHEYEDEDKGKDLNAEIKKHMNQDGKSPLIDDSKNDDDNKFPLIRDSNVSNEDNQTEQEVKNMISPIGQLASGMAVRNAILENDNNEKKELNKGYESAFNKLSKLRHEEEELNEESHSHKNIKPSNSFTPIILLVALSLHGFFEGIALGISNEFKAVLFLFLAIAAHKWAESLTLGISFHKAHTDGKTLVTMIFIFSLFGPLGVFLGLCLSSLINNPIVTGVFLGISSGTFLYVYYNLLIYRLLVVKL